MMVVPVLPKISLAASTPTRSFSACGDGLHRHHCQIHEVGSRINKGNDERTKKQTQPDIAFWILYFAGYKGYIVPAVTAK